MRRIVRRELGTNRFAVARGFRVGVPGGIRERRPVWLLGVLELRRADPPVLDRRVDIGRIRGRAGHPRKAKGDIRRPYDGAGLFAEFDGRDVAQREPRLIEGIELLEDQQGDRLAEIERRLADRAQQVAGVEFGHPCADARQVVSGHHHGGFQGAGQAREIEAVIDVGCIRGPDEHGVRGLRRPARKIGGTKIRGVELRSRDLGDAVDATDAGGCRVPALPPRQRLASGEPGFLGHRQARQAEHDATGRRRFDELAARHAHFAVTLLSSGTGPSPGFLEKRGITPTASQLVVHDKNFENLSTRFRISRRH